MSKKRELKYVILYLVIIIILGFIFFYHDGPIIPTQDHEVLNIINYKLDVLFFIIITYFGFKFYKDYLE